MGASGHENFDGFLIIKKSDSVRFGASKSTPDLVIEVTFSSGSPKKLQRYQPLQIPEVWFWQNGAFSLYRLIDNHYEAIAKSQIPELANLDIDLLTNCIAIAQTSRLEASNTFRNAIKKR